MDETDSWDEIPKYKKKSSGKKYCKSKHKHKYQRAWVCYEMYLPYDDKTSHKFQEIEEVCTICGRRRWLSYATLHNLKEQEITEVLPYYHAVDYLSNTVEPMSEEGVRIWKGSQEPHLKNLD